MPEHSATRTIVTFHPEVSCDVCERSLLRGEQSEVFLDSGRQRTVCELCAPRAAQAGWRRASGPVEDPETAEQRQRSGRSLLRRLRGNGRDERDERRPTPTYEPRAIDNVAPATPVAAAAREPLPVESAPETEHDPALPTEQPPAQLAAEIFNRSEFPRRIAGVARSLGVPEVSLWSAEHHPAVVRILVAWELSWYRYEVDLTDQDPSARVIGQGSELGDLPREERLGNVTVDEAGQLAWTSV